MSDIVVVGSCMVDFSCYADRFPNAGETMFGKNFIVSNGGKGANQCVAASRLGASTGFVALLGADSFGKEYFEKLKLENIDVSNVQFRQGIHTGIAHITVTDSGENSIIIVPGANSLLSPDDVTGAEELIKKSKVLLCQFEVPPAATLRALKTFRGHGLSILNGAPAEKNPDPELLKSCDIFCLNEIEILNNLASAVQRTTSCSTFFVHRVKQSPAHAEIMTDVPVSEAFESRDIIVKRLLSRGCNAVLLTLGALGAVYGSRDDSSVIYIPTTKVTAEDTTGAGDAFLGSFAYFAAYHPSLTTEEKVRRACYVASQSVLKKGTQSSFPYKKDLPTDLFTD